ncbi:hypothetical protein [Brevundimonas goettingensis]|uniref:Uncharacterized protein n=1 Tax=Brevundimonas goettingensis TaxID=2774190 RepID=A0A975C129_9CAUL|nr:hypothetical protein [Brevundimonas goettingensis]QTC91079.1 hypothetical protein IFJ75_17985 [Brevundimonas goettingensis]
MAGPVHYEIYIRKTAPSPWTLSMATEDRKNAIETAEDLMRDRQAVAVKVTKETLDPDTMEFNTVVLMTRGAAEAPRKKVAEIDTGPACKQPGDLYTPHARELIGRVLEDWLHRNSATPYELLHRPDLVERLEASGVELQHALQKIAIPEAQANGMATHDLIRHYQKLTGQAMERVITAGRRNLFSNLADHSLADIAHRISGAPDRAFIIGGVICGALVGIKGARARLGALMDLADRAPPSGPPRALVLVGLEQILCELFASRTNLAEILGPSLDQGGSMAAIVRMVAPREIDRLVRADPRLALLMPIVDGPAARLGEHLAAGEFPILAASLARLVLRELMGPRRLRPTDPVGEIDILRTLAMSLTATAGRLLTMEEVQNAFIERSKSLVTADFVQAYVSLCETVLCEAETLTRLCENVTGGANKRSAARWLVACVTSLRFETEMRNATTRPTQKLHVLAGLQRSVRACALAEHDETQITAAIGEVGGVVEGEAKLTAQLAKAQAPAPQKLAVLLRLAAGETAPFGPAADRAKAEVIRLFRAPDTRVALGAAPEALGELKGLMKSAGLAA